MSWQAIKNQLYEYFVSIFGGISTVHLLDIEWSDAQFNLFNWVVATFFGCIGAALFAIMGKLAVMWLESTSFYQKRKLKRNEKNNRKVESPHS